MERNIKLGNENLSKGLFASLIIFSFLIVSVMGVLTNPSIADAANVSSIDKTVTTTTIEIKNDKPNDDIIEIEEVVVEEVVLGSLRVCKTIVDSEGNVTDGHDLKGKFGISGVDFNDPAGVIPTSQFSTTLAFNADVFDFVEGNDAKCFTYDNLDLGSYYYGEEQITGDDAWKTPLYNDQHTSLINSLKDFFPYSGELFNEDTDDDSSRESNSDGHVVLSTERPDRTVVVLNSFEEIADAPYCGDGVINQGWEQCDGDSTNKDLAIFEECIFSDGTGECTGTDLNEDGAVNFLDLGLFKSALQYDFNNDLIVDLNDSDENIDLNFFKKCFLSDGTGECTGTDLNEDGVVNFLDLGLFKSALQYDFNNDLIVDLREGGQCTLDCTLVDDVDHADNSCPFEDKDGRVIIDFEDGNIIRSDNNDTFSGPVDAIVSAGTYKVTLASFDGYENRVNTTQPEEVWKLELFNDNGTVAVSNKTTDLIDNVKYVSSVDVVNTELEVSETTFKAKAVHAASDDAETANSVEPVCAALDLVAGDQNPGNTQPVITIQGDNPLELLLGDLYLNPGATAYDDEDGNISDDITWDDSSVDTSVVGTYYVTYNVEDSEGLAALEQERTVIVSAEGIPNDLPYAPYCGDGIVNQSWERCDGESTNKDLAIFEECIFSDGTGECTGTDLNEDGAVNFLDLGLFKSALQYDFNNDLIVDLNDSDENIDLNFFKKCFLSDGTGECTGTDLNEDGAVNFLDLGLFKSALQYDFNNDLIVDLREGGQCTQYCTLPNQCAALALARVNTIEFNNYEDGDVSSDVFLGSTLNKIPGGAWFAIFDSGTFFTDADMTSAGYENVPGIAVERLIGKVRTLVFGSHPHNGSKENIIGNVEFYNIDVVEQLNDESGNNKVERPFDNFYDDLPGHDELSIDGNKSEFFLTVTTADDGFYTTYGEGPQCQLPNQRPEITLIGDNPLVIDLFSTYENPGAIAYDNEDGDISSDIVVGGDTVNPNEVGSYTVTYNVSDSEGLDATEVTRIVKVIDEDQENPVCSDGADNDGDGFTDADDAACHTDGDAGNPDSFNPDGDSENERPVITLTGNSTIDIMVGTDFTDLLATANDTEDGDITTDIVVAGDVVATTTIGTYVITYNVMDSEGLSAVEVTRTVNVLEEVNERPVITLTGNTTVELTTGNTFTDEGATANDVEDGDITINIVVAGDSVDENTAGTYVITYNVVDSKGLAALEVTRTVIVSDPTNGGENPSTPTGRGGGGGFIPNNLTIFNEQITVVSEGVALITWNTNKPANSRVVFDDDSQVLNAGTLNLGTGEQDLGYEFTTVGTTGLVTEHSVLVTNVNLEDLFYFRPISEDGTRAIGIELSALLGQVSAGSCSQYLFEFIKFGEANSVDEVEKLQIFLNDFEGENLAITGIYNAATFEAVEKFQNKYSNDVLGPWGLEGDTGYVYLTTRKKINEIYCNFQLPFPLTEDQESEVNGFKGLLESLRSQGLPLPDTSNIGVAPTTPILAIEDTDPNVTLTEETIQGEDTVLTGESSTSDLANALDSVSEGTKGVFSKVKNFIKGLFR